MRKFTEFAGVLSLTGVGALAGCGAGAPACTSTLVMSVGPVAGTADHAAAAPGNQQQFQAVGTYRTTVSGCAVPALAVLFQPDWTVSDPVNVQISSTKDSTNGLATCLGPTAGAVMVTAIGTGSASLTCK